MNTEKKEIPHFVQVLKKSIPPKELESELISNYNNGGLEIDCEMKRRNPNAQKEIMFVSSAKPIHIGAAKYQIKGNEEKGSWIYCGHLWYVRKIEKKFEFSQYSIYNTKTKLIEGLWDEEKCKE